jgi:hypothetical protein
MNLNQLAKQICALEGGKQNLSIAQVKEVLKCLGLILEESSVESALLIVAKLAKPAGK